MNYLVPSQMSARRQTIGRTEYIVISSFCGEENIIKRLEHLMQSELIEEEATKNNLPKTLDNQQR